MRSGRRINAVRTDGLSASAATDLLLAALAGAEPLALNDAEREAALVGSARVEDPEVALTVLTSGSTGTPKIVGLSGPALVASATASLVRLGARAKASWSLLLPLHHIAGVQVLLRAAINEGPVLGVNEQVDFTSIVPTQLHRALHGDQALLEHLRAAQAVLVGGAALDEPLRSAATHAGISIVTTYGMTETAGGCVYDGLPLDGVEVRIGEQGQISISGPMLATGYLNDPLNPAFSGRWFHTSDIGSWQNQRLHLAGRSDPVINSGGEKIALPAIEAALRTHPMVIDAIAAGAPDATWGERLIVGIVASGQISLTELRDHVTERLGRVHAPRGLVVLREIPRSALGKPDRFGLLSHQLDEEI